MRNPPAARRACADATSPAPPAAPANTPHVGQAGLPPGRPAGGLPRGRPVGPAGRLAAGQPVLVEPVPHRGRLDAKLAGDAGGWPLSGYRPVGQVCPQGSEAQLRRSGGELLVGGGAPRVGGGHPRRGDVVMPVGAGGGVIHAPGMLGDTHPWEIRIPEVTSGDGSISGDRKGHAHGQRQRQPRRVHVSLGQLPTEADDLLRGDQGMSLSTQLVAAEQPTVGGGCSHAPRRRYLLCSRPGA
jgi:hypothetical protein